MKKVLFFVMLGGLLISCSTTRNLSNAATPEKSASTNKNDGSSYEKAVVIKKKHELKGVNAEYVWLRHNYPGYRSKGQSLNFNENKSYDIITIVTADGIEKKIYFDISKFYGKY